MVQPHARSRNRHAIVLSGCFANTAKYITVGGNWSSDSPRESFHIFGAKAPSFSYLIFAGKGADLDRAGATNPGKPDCPTSRAFMENLCQYTLRTHLAHSRSCGVLRRHNGRRIRSVFRN